MNKWDKNFLELAKTVSTFSKDPSTQVGAVIVDDDNRVVSIGYNAQKRIKSGLLYKFYSYKIPYLFFADLPSLAP